MINKIITGSAIIVLANLVNRGVGMATMPLLTRMLGSDAYGEAALISTLISLMSVIALTGMDMSYTRAYYDNKYVAHHVESYAWIYVYTSAIGVSVVGFIFFANSNSSLMGVMLAIGVFASCLMTMSQTMARLKDNIIKLALGIVAGGCMSNIFTYMLAEYKLLSPAECMVAGYIVGYFVPVLFTGIFLPKKIQQNNSLTKKNKIDIWKIGVAGVVTAPMYWLISSVDKWFLNYYSGSGAVGVYTVGVTIATIGMFLNSALISIWMPAASKYYSENNLDRDEVIVATTHKIIFSMGFVWLNVALFGGYLLKILSDSEFHGAVLYIPWIAGGVLFYGLYHVLGTKLFLEGKLKYSAKAMLIGGVFVVIGNFLFVKHFGGIACAVFQCLGFLMASILVYYSSVKLKCVCANYLFIVKNLLWFLLIYGVASFVGSESVVVEVFAKISVVISSLLVYRYIYKIRA